MWDVVWYRTTPAYPFLPHEAHSCLIAVWLEYDFYRQELRLTFVTGTFVVFLLLEIDMSAARRCFVVG